MNASESNEEAYIVLRSLGLGFAFVFKAPLDIDVDVPPGSVAPSGQMVFYFAFYLGNIILNAVLAACDVTLYLIEGR